jgi:hypothetical protein
MRVMCRQSGARQAAYKFSTLASLLCTGKATLPDVRMRRGFSRGGERFLHCKVTEYAGEREGPRIDGC